jgi:hypothetical protein
MPPKAPVKKMNNYQRDFLNQETNSGCVMFKIKVIFFKDYN